MKKILILLGLLAACSSQEEPRRDGNPMAPAAAQKQSAPADEPSRIATLTGLYEGGSAAQPNRMCIVEGKADERRFGLVVWGGNLHSCSGSGTVTRQGGKLRLAMAGDSACTIEATISGKTVKLPETVPSGCAYYCGARATLGGAELTQKGTTKAAALEAKDLVGESLCGAQGG
ncbi:MAG TPA: hypothetical protein VK391_01075 [Allosphingosinicella sp.]|nr:hypothetical protein [Allosphingosinicella sp.]